MLRAQGRIPLLKGGELLGWHLGILDASQPVAGPVVAAHGWGKRLLRSRLRRLRTAPLGLRRTVHGTGLVSLGVDVLWQRGAVLVGHAVGGLAVLQKL